MNTGLKRRLDRIERAIPKPTPALQWDAAKWTASLTEQFGITREGNESWAEAISRWMGITSGQLRDELQRLGAGPVK